MNSKNLPKPEPPARRSNVLVEAPARMVRCAIAGVLMGLANLVPGVSGGTMVLIMGLYDEFISSIADVTRLKFRTQSILFLGILGGAIAVTIVALSGKMADAVEEQRSVMYALFIGLTLGGAPLLWRMAKPIKAPSVITMGCGFGLMVALAVMSPAAEAPNDTAAETSVVEPVDHSYGRDVAAGVLGMGAMVLPGISGAFMFLIIGRYEAILTSISQIKEYALSFGKSGDLEALHVLVPVAIGAILSLLVVTNLMKWLLHRHKQATAGLLLGILLGSVIRLWPMQPESTGGDYAKAVLALAVGVALTTGLARIGNKPASVKRA